MIAPNALRAALLVGILGALAGVWITTAIEKVAYDIHNPMTEL